MFGDWIPLLSALAGLVGGGGGVVAFLRWRSDNANGRRSFGIDSNKSAVEAWEKLARTQAEVIVTPLVEEVAGLKEQIKSLKAEVAALRKFRDKFMAALEYITALHGWIAEHLPSKKNDLPPVPPELADDLKEKK